MVSQIIESLLHVRVTYNLIGRLQLQMQPFRSHQNLEETLELLHNLQVIILLEVILKMVHKPSL